MYAFVTEGFEVVNALVLLRSKNSTKRNIPEIFSSHTIYDLNFVFQTFRSRLMFILENYMPKVS